MTHHADGYSERDAAQQDNAKLNKQLQIDEEALMAQKMFESKGSELLRARLISQALLMGKVKEYMSDPQYGSFIIFDALMPEVGYGLIFPPQF